ncbi:MAG: hypothetical protein ACUVR3_01455, partial [Candidatus Roseilinea sp.]|uniref:hypothetical protein n=1 Tax=Candidatus Roseilinea sp. TaxID=2838777 RepID=UPI0040498FE3
MSSYWPARQPARAYVLAVLAVALLVAAAIALLPLSQLALAGVAALALGAIVLTLAEPVIGLCIALVIAPFAPLENIMLRLPVDS